MKSINSTAGSIAQPFSSTGHVLLDCFSDLNPGLVRQHFKKAGDVDFVVRARNYRPDDIETLQKKIGRGYFTQLGFLASKSDVSAPWSAPSSVKMTRFRNVEEAREWASKTLKISLIEPWRSYLGEKMVDVFSRSVDSSITLECSVVFMYKSQIVGMAYHFPHQDCVGNEVGQIGWIWIQPDLPKDLRREIRSHMATWLQSLKFGFFQAGIHLYNISSQRFFAAIGFQLRCAHILQVNDR